MSLIKSFEQDTVITMRPTYTAEFLISSDDRLPFTDNSATAFTLGGGLATSQGAKTGNGYAVGYGGAVSLYNGMFNRMALTELDMYWAIENISGSLWGNNTIEFHVSVAGGAFNDYEITLPNGFYNVSQCLQQIVFELNSAIGTTEFYVIPPGGYVAGSSLDGSGQCQLAMKSVGSVFIVVEGSALAQALSVATLQLAQSCTILRPNLLPIDYVDFVCRQLTDNMSLKDGTTSSQSTPVLSRWYFAPESDQYDVYGFKILQGYTPFTARRVFSTPKQMKWDPKMPIGQLSFEVRVPNNWRPSNWSDYYYSPAPYQENGTVLNLTLVDDKGSVDQNPWTNPIFGFQMKLAISEQ